MGRVGQSSYFCGRVVASCYFIYASPRCFFASHIILFRTLHSSSCTLAGGQTHPSPPSGHPPLLLAVKLPLLCPEDILLPCWQQTSPLPTWRGHSTPVGGQLHHSSRLLVLQEESYKEGRREMGDGRQETIDERQNTRDKRREARDEM